MTSTAPLAWTVAPAPAPVGDLLLTSDGVGLTRIFFLPHRGSEAVLERCRREGVRDPSLPALAGTAEQLAEYFAGHRTRFELPLAASGTAFQHRVWAALQQVEFGRTESYGALARRLGLPPGAARAVGLANGANPLSIVVPCHRVIGADGSLTGYGGGIERKRFLLDHERGALF